MLDEALAMAGHEVVLAADGGEATRKHRENPADLVIMDLFMPNKEGLETMSELLKDSPDTAIVAISGNFIAANMLAVARQMGATEILQKPFFPEELLEVVERLLSIKARPA